MDAIGDTLGEIVRYMLLIFLLMFGFTFVLKMYGVDPKSLGMFAPLIEAAAIFTGAAKLYDTVKDTELVKSIKKRIGAKDAEAAEEGAKGAEEGAKAAEEGAKAAEEGAKSIEEGAKAAEEFVHII